MLSASVSVVVVSVSTEVVTVVISSRNEEDCLGLGIKFSPRMVGVLLFEAFFDLF